jgi:hypothetical protein
MDLPDITALFLPSLDASGAQYGLRLDEEAARRLASGAPLEALLGGCGPARAPAEAAAALLLLARAPSPDEVLERGEEALEALLGDRRVYHWQWGERSYQRRSLEVALLAVEAWVGAWAQRLRRARAPRGAAQEPEAALLAALVRAARAALWGGGDALRALARGSRRFLTFGQPPEPLMEALAQALAGVAADPGEVAERRLLALRELCRAAPQGAPFAEALEVGLDALERDLCGPLPDVRLRAQAPGALLEVSPARIDALLARGGLPWASLPPPEALLTRWGRVEEPRAQALAARVRWPELLDALTQGAPEEALSAAAVAPWLGERAPWERLARRLTEAIARPERWSSLQEGAGRAPQVEVGIFAAQRLLRLLSGRLREGDEAALRWLQVGLAALLSRGGGARELLPLLQQLVEATRMTPEVALAAWRPWLAQVSRDRDRAAEARMAALLLDRTDDAIARAAALLLDPAEDFALRSLIGQHLHRWDCDAVEALVLTDVTPWALPLEGRADLPIGEPAQEAPLPWLAQSAQGHPLARAQAIRALGARLSRGRTSPEHLAASLALRALASDALRGALREAVQDRHPEAPRWGAAICLALLGEPQDEEALVGYMRRHGPWSALDPTREDLHAVKMVDHLLLKPLQHPEPHHLLEPALWAGYGPERGARLMARTFIEMSADALQHGLLEHARLACQRARGLDPLNLQARRFGRALGL